jgi:glucans biosynthesis protein C
MPAAPPLAPPGNERLHALDALRGIMMMLGIVLHAAIPYSTLPVETFSWKLLDRERNAAFDVVILFVHSFRIPLFFLLSGFFAHLLLARKGERYLVASRIRRILVPFVFGFVLLTPLVHASGVFALALPEHPVASALAAGVQTLFSPGTFVAGLGLMHLWFLYYLLLINGVVLLGIRLAGAVSAGGRSTHSGGAGMALILAICAVLLYGMHTGTLDTPLHFWPIDLRVLLFYLTWFLAGWALFARPQQMATIRRDCLRFLVVGMLALGVHLFILAGFFSSTEVAAPVPVRALNAIAASAVTTFLCFGILGGFGRLFPASSRAITFLGESSYWVYLIHIPFVLIVAGLAQLLETSAFIKYPLVVAGSAALSMGSYVLVRPMHRRLGARRAGVVQRVQPPPAASPLGGAPRG